MSYQHLLSKAPLEAPEPVGINVLSIREPSTQYFLLDSADRNQNSAFTPFGTTIQPWNDFRVQKPQSILNAFARRIQPVEIRFPWFIPNITSYNNFIYLGGNFGDDKVSLPLYNNGQNLGGYTPEEIVNTLNAGIEGLIPVNPPTFAYNSATMQYTFSNPDDSADTYVLNTGIPPGGGNGPFYTVQQYFQNASLMRTLGFTPLQQGEPITPGNSMTGLPTNSTYTDYVDICSDKLMYYTDVKDGSSSASKTNPSVIIRLYANDEVSVPYSNEGVPYTCRPFMIHRQFKNAKSIKWNPEAVLDWCDISVYDMHGNLVYLPRDYLTSTTLSAQPGYYPDFQITFLASEQ